MKVWWVLAWETYYPEGGLGNVDSCWETEEEAQARVDEIRKIDADGWEYYDHVVIENVSERLGL